MGSPQRRAMDNKQSIFKTLVSVAALAAFCIIGAPGASTQTSWKVLAYYGGKDDSSAYADAENPAVREETWVSPAPVGDYAIGAIMPQLFNDPYWLAVTYGIVEEGRRLGLDVSLSAEGEIGKISLQIRRVEERMNRLLDGAILAAANYPATNEVVAKVTAQGIPVLALVKGRNPSKILAKVEVSPRRRGYLAGTFVAHQATSRTAPVDVVILAGPAGSDWAPSIAEGFRRAVNKLAPGKIRILDERWGDMDKYIQLELVESALAAFKHIDYLICNAVAAEVAPAAIEAAGRTKEVKVISAYITPTVWKQVAFGKIAAAIVGFPVLQGKMAVDMLAMLLQGKQVGKQVPLCAGPKLALLTPDNYMVFPTDGLFAPQHWRPVFALNAGTESTEPTIP